MNFKSLFIAGALLAVGSAFAVEATVPGEALVKFKVAPPGFLPGGAKLVRYFAPIKVAHIRIAGKTAAQAAAVFAGRSDVVYAEPNIVRTFNATVNDPLVPQQYTISKLKCPQAWDLGTGNPGVIVAVLDSGFEVNHQDMAGKFIAGFDFMDNDTNPMWVGSPHGVETSGCVAAATNNGIGIAAVGYNCRVMPIRVGDTGIPTANSIAGMMYAADHGAKVINMSYGGPTNQQSEKDASDYAWNKGCVIVASAGNSGDQGNLISYPADYPHVISVGATDSNDQKASFTQFGPWVEVAAPGVNVMTTMPNNQYGGADGTSFSSPIVAGLAGLLFSFAQPGTTNTEIRNAIESTTDNVGTWLANGRVNAFRAMQVFDVVNNVIEFNATAVAPVYGNYVSGDAASVVASDQLFYSMASVNMVGGQTAGVSMDIPVGTSTNLRKATLEVEAKGIAGSTMMVYVFNYNTSTYQLVKSGPLNENGNNKLSIAMSTTLDPYVAGGPMRLLVKALNPQRPFSSAPANPFTLGVGYASLKVVPNN